MLAGPGGLSLNKSAIVHFSDRNSMLNNDEQDYEYVLDCCSTVDKSALCLAISNQHIQILDRQTLQLGAEFVAHDSTINELWVSTVLPWKLGSCSSDHTAKIWDLRSNTAAIQMNFGEEAWSISVGCDENLLVAGTHQKAQFYDLRNGKKLAEYGDSHFDDVTQVRFNPIRQHQVVTASEDGIVCLFDATIPNEDDAVMSIINAESAITKIGFCGSDLSGVFCLTGTETLDIWNLESAQRVGHFPEIRRQCEQLNAKVDYLVDCCYDSASNKLYMIAGNHQGVGSVFRIEPGSIFYEAQLGSGHKSCIRCIDWNDDFLFTGGEDSRVCSWQPPMKSNVASTCNTMNRAIRGTEASKKLKRKTRPY